MFGRHLAGLHGPSSSSSSTSQSVMQTVIALLWLISSTVDVAAAAPALQHLGDRNGQERLIKRDSNNSGNGVQPQVWIPAVVVVIVLLVVFVLLWTKTNMMQRLRGFTNAVGGVDTTREVTAVQLAGGSATNNNSTTTGPTTTTRPRRTRRTPSQISTTSLPVYMKEPGDLELVVIRGPDDMDDVPLTEQGPGGETVPQSNIYDPRSAASQMSLSQNESSVNVLASTGSSAALLQGSALALTASIDSDAVPPSSTNASESNGQAESMDERTAGSSRRQSTRIPSGDAPPYEEISRQFSRESEFSRDSATPSDPSSTLPVSPPGLSPPPGTATPTVPSSSAAPQDRQSAAGNANPVEGLSRTARRRSALLNFFNLPGHRSHNGAPTTSAAPASSARASPHPSRHRPSGSGGSSSIIMPGLSHILPRSPSSHTLTSFVHRAGSTANLNSPSVISLNSISAPLAHTLVRTEFRYPRDGPTPEQMRFISSRESLGRFGVPYGADAIAHAAATSRLELDPPPEFQAATGGVDGLPVASSPLAQSTFPEDISGEGSRGGAGAGNTSQDSSNGSGRNGSGHGRMSSLGSIDSFVTAEDVVQARSPTPAAHSPRTASDSSASVSMSMAVPLPLFI